MSDETIIKIIAEDGSITLECEGNAGDASYEFAQRLMRELALAMAGQSEEKVDE